MIRSQREYNVTSKRLAEFDKSIADFDLTAVPVGVQPSAHRAALQALIGLREDLHKELLQYERLRTDGMAAVKVTKLADLPGALVQARLAQDMSQAQLAAEIGVKPQQVQRWESEEYENVGFSTLLDIANVLGLDGCVQFQKQTVHRPSILVDRITIAEKHSSGGTTKEIVWKSQGDSNSISFGPDSVTVRGLGKAQDGEFRRHQPVHAEWTILQPKLIAGVGNG